MDATRHIFLWPPQGHTRNKLAGHLSERGVSFDNRGSDNCLIIDTDVPTRLLVTLVGLLNAGEAADTRVLCAQTKQPSLADFGKIYTLKSLMDRMRGDWLIDLIDNKRYVSYAQPIVSAAAPRDVVGHEFLLRGLDENGELVYPDTLFNSAKDPRILFNLDRAARINAVQTASRMDAKTDIFVNFMPGSIYDPAVCLRTTVQAVIEAGVSAHRVVFEIVESERIDDLAHLRGIVNFYRDAGFRIALDDFGAGHSNMDAFIALSPDFVKLDKALTSNLTSDDARIAIVSALTRTFQSAGIKVIAEGIETEENARLATDCGVDRLQGYFFGRPAAVPSPQGG